VAFLRDFRKKVALLKKQGLVSAQVDARSAFPKWKSDGKSLKSLVAKYDDVVSGKVTAVKVKPEALKKFKAVGYETSKRRVLVPHDEGETAKLVAGGRIVIKNTSGIERVQIPVEYHNLEQYFSDIEKNSDLIDLMKYKNEWWGFRYFAKNRGLNTGYANSSEIYRNIDLLIEKVRGYETTMESLPGTGRRRHRGDVLYGNLEIYRISKSQNWVHPMEHKREKTKARNRKTSKLYRKRKGSDPKYLAAQAERQRKYREKLKGRKKEEYKRKARKRAKKARKK